MYRLLVLLFVLSLAACGDDASDGNNANNTNNSNNANNVNNSNNVNYSNNVNNSNNINSLNNSNNSNNSNNTNNAQPLVGDACQSSADCGVLDCQLESEAGWTGGYCTQACTNDDACPAGSHCDGESCRKSCENADACRSPEYGCFDGDNDNVTECAPLAIGNGTVGAPCVNYAECAGGELGACIVQSGEDFPGGYCTIARCTADAGCPQGSSCLEATSTNVCLLDCLIGDECRDSYQCATVIEGTMSCVPTNL